MLMRTWMRAGAWVTLVVLMLSAAAIAEAQNRQRSGTTPRNRSAAPARPSLPAATTSTRESLPGLLQTVLTAQESVANWGVYIALAETGDVLFQRNATRGYIPASNRKLFTGAFALDQLGPDFQYRTYLYRTGPVAADGTLKGSLVIRPEGDPTFSNRLVRGASVPEDWIFRDWAQKVKAAGITSVEGELIVDCSNWDLRDLTPEGWAERVKLDHYAPRTSPLTLRDNLIELRISPAASGQPGKIEFRPAAQGYPIVNRTTTGEKTSGLRATFETDQGPLVVHGTIGAKAETQSVVVPCDRPALYAAAVLRNHLHTAGIPVHGSLSLTSQKGRLPQPTSENVVAVYISPPMSEIVSLMMKRSNNHFAEQLYVSVSAIKTGNGGYRASRALEEQFLRKAGAMHSGLKLADGCGLSEANRVSPQDVARLLFHMKSHPARDAFFASLPISGRDGTLSSRMRSGAAAQKVFAKTGFINRVSCLSGYVTVAPQRTIVFSFLVNDVRISVSDVRLAQDRLCEMLAMAAL